MPLLANPRHEAFAKNLAAGLTQYDSYINAGFEGNPSAASQLAKRPEVKQRVQELIEERQTARRQQESEEHGSEISQVDRDWIVRQLKKNIEQAQVTGQISAANKGVEMLMELFNLMPKKGAPPVEEDTTKKTNATPDDSKMHDILDKIESMGGFTVAPEAFQEED